MSALHSWRVELSDANAFVDQHHRHHEPEVGHRFSLGVGNGVLRGVAICGRPKAGHSLDQKRTLEVLRVATDGTRNACSWLYSAAARMARELGFYAVITYTLTVESGSSLRAVGWWPEELGQRDADWRPEGRTGQGVLFDLPRRGQDIACPKVRWLWLTGNDWEAS